MKKICFFSGDITRSGGTERVAAMIANGLQQTGRYEIVFLSLVEKNKDTFFPLDSAVSRYALGEKWISPGPGYLKAAAENPPVYPAAEYRHNRRYRHCAGYSFHSCLPWNESKNRFLGSF